MRTGLFAKSPFRREFHNPSSCPMSDANAESLRGPGPLLAGTARFLRKPTPQHGEHSGLLWLEASERVSQFILGFRFEFQNQIAVQIGV